MYVFKLTYILQQKKRWIKFSKTKNFFVSVRIVIVDFGTATRNDSLTRPNATLTHECTYRVEWPWYTLDACRGPANKPYSRHPCSSHSVILCPRFFVRAGFPRWGWRGARRGNPQRSGFCILALRGTTLLTGRIRANNNRLHSHDDVSAVTVL